MTGHFAHGSNMLCWQAQDTAQCPQCNKEETKQHIICCTALEAQAKWSAILLNLQRWLSYSQTLQQALLAVLNQWSQDEQTQYPHPAAQGQAKLGPDSLVDGWISCEWCHH